MGLRTPTARRILEDLETLDYLIERGYGRIKPEDSNSDYYWEVGAEQLASAASLSRWLGRLLTRLGKRGDNPLPQILNEWSADSITVLKCRLGEGQYVPRIIDQNIVYCTQLFTVFLSGPALERYFMPI